VSGVSRPTLWLVAALSALLGGVSLLLFFAVLLAGPFELLPLGLVTPAALLWDGGLCLVFFVQHSVMVRQTFRDRLARAVPARVQPALYSVASGIALLLLVGLWQRSEMGLLVVEGPARWALRAVFLGATLAFIWALRVLDSFDPFGLRALQARPEEDSFVIRGPYRWVRHPLYALFLVMLWSSPDLTADRLLFNVLFSGWLVLGTILEERDLVRRFGDPYRQYQRAVPMLIPWRRSAPFGNGGVR